MAIDEPTLALTYQRMQERLGALLPGAEIKIKAELVFEIQRLKKERGAVILGHNYMEPALFQTVPDIVGDSLQLSREAARTESKIIIFCGVRFMAETAKILNPSKQVLIPAERAGCSLAESITAADVRALRAAYPGVPIVAYINTYADVKAEVDVCCTSSNAVRVVQSFSEPRIIFLPDEYLARNVARETGKEILVARPGALTVSASPAPVMIGWKGRCEVHERFQVTDITNARKQFSDVVVIAHPECSPEVVAQADFSGSTTEMVKYVQSRKGGRYLILTECSTGDNIIAENPDKEILRMCNIRCPHMNEITLEDTLQALRLNRYEVDVPEPTRSAARRAVERMIAL